MRSWVFPLHAGVIAMCMAGCVHGVRTQENLCYAKAGTRSQHLTLFLPEGGLERGPRPCVLLVHGGAWTGGTRYQLRWYGNRLAEEGYVAAAISYRKLPRYGFPACVEDAKAAVRWLRLNADACGIDPDRIAALGNSAGGHIVAMLAATGAKPAFEGTENPGPSSRISAAVSLYGALDLTEYKRPTGWISIGGIAKRMMRRFVAKDYKGGEDPYVVASPLTYFDQDTAPMLLIQGENDNLVPYVVAQRAYEKLEEAGVKSRLISVPERGHAFDFFYPRKRNEIFQEILAFLNETIGPPGARAAAHE